MVKKCTRRGLGCIVPGRDFRLPLSLWVYGCLTETKQQVCVEPGTNRAAFIFNCVSRKKDDVEVAASTSGY